jgi:uncharacterized protein (UPF0261 family)
VGTGAIVPELTPDVPNSEVRRLGEKAAQSEQGGQTEKLTSLMAKGLAAKTAALHDSGQLQGMIAIAGMTGSLISLPSMKALPFGVPKLLISSAAALPVHADRFAEYYAVRDITVMHAAVDTVGMNALVKILAVNGANAISGMVEGGAIPSTESKPCIAITEFGFCDKGAHYIREILENDYELVSFHATGMGDKAAIDLTPQGFFRAFIDLVPGAFSEYLLGGNRGIAGPNRLDIALDALIPYILCPGGFDMISCGPVERKDRDDPLWSSRRLAERKLYLQDAFRVQARMNREELKLVAEEAAKALNRYHRKERIKIIIPQRGFSSLSVEGGSLYEPRTDEVFAATLRQHLDPAIEISEVDSDINSPLFAEAVVAALRRAIGLAD